MSLKVALITFIVSQSYPVSSQQQGANPGELYIPQGWFRPLYSAAADSWRDYIIRAQQATNQFYKQWANLTGISNPGGGLGGFGALEELYGGGNQQQGLTDQTPRPLQGIFNPSNIPIGLDMSWLLPGNQKPGQYQLQDSPHLEKTLTHLQQIKPQTVPSVQQSLLVQQQSLVRQYPPSQQSPPVQQPIQVQPKPQPQVQQQPPQQSQQPLNTQTQSRPLQTLGQVTNTVGLFGGANPRGWTG